MLTFHYADKSQINEVIDLRKDVGVYNEDEDSPNSLLKTIERDTKAILIGILDDKIIASALLVFHPFQTFIYRFGIHSDYIGKGIGSLLAQKIDGELMQRGMLHPTLFVEGDNEVGKKFRTKQGRDNIYSVDCFVKNLEK